MNIQASPNDDYGGTKTSQLSFKPFSPTHWAILLAALLLMPLIAVYMRVFGFRRCHQLLRYITPQHKCKLHAQSKHEFIRTAAHLVNIAARGPYRARCLIRSMTLQVLLRKKGIDSDLILGARRHNNLLEAHAWLRVDSRPIDLSEKTYLPLGSV